MIESDMPRFRKVMAVLYVTFQRDPDPVLGEVYFQALKDLSIDSLEKASMLATQRLKFFPKPAELRELVEGNAALPAATIEDEAEIATGQAFAAISSVGQYRSVTFDDPAIHMTVEDLSGWGAFCRGPDNGHRRREFKQLYIAHRKRIARVGLAECRVPRILFGEHGSNEPKLIGDKGKIVAWRNEALGIAAAEPAGLLEGDRR